MTKNDMATTNDVATANDVVTSKIVALVPMRHHSERVPG